MRVMVYVPKQTKASHIKLGVVSLHFILHVPHFKGGAGRVVEGAESREGRLNKE